MKVAVRQFGALAAIVATAVTSSVLTFIILVITGWIGPPTGPDVPMQIAVILSIVFIWGPAFALVPAAIVGFFVARPMARRALAHSRGGFAPFALVSIAASVALWVVLRMGSSLIGGDAPFIDITTLVVFLAIGLCSALSWWLLVVLPGRATPSS